MKNITYLFACLFLIGVIFTNCKKKEISTGLPDNLISATPDSVLIAKQTALFIENRSVPNNYPILFDTIHEKRIILKNDAFVYVTFLKEGASWTNSLGYYSYLVSNPPSITDKNILYPNISESGSGGALKPGDMVQIGNGVIPKGTVIGFYLVAQGWGDGHLTDGVYTNYTDKIFNVNKNQQSILFIEKTTGKLVLGFEDTLTDNSILINNLMTDKDFNDIVLSISDSKDPSAVPTSFDLSEVPSL